MPRLPGGIPQAPTHHPDGRPMTVWERIQAQQRLMADHKARQQQAEVAAALEDMAGVSARPWRVACDPGLSTAGWPIAGDG